MSHILHGGLPQTKYQEGGGKKEGSKRRLEGQEEGRWRKQQGEQPMGQWLAQKASFFAWLADGTMVRTRDTGQGQEGLRVLGVR